MCTLFFFSIGVFPYDACEIHMAACMGDRPTEYRMVASTALALKFVYGPLPNPHYSYILVL
jgi:hypothetical protein